ncbi:Ig-like domain-containing protein, partial [Polaromonas sp.]|uniref:Ig-like domain-containing protein n=1 Tax=Polaromonas sp. TaxID=1869339 RepID=UPI002FC8499F
LGLHHAHALDCGDTTLGSSCTAQEYGDTLDIMGYSGTVGHFNGFSKERLGWLASSNIINVASGGNFYLKPAATQTTSGKVLKIANGLDSSGAPNYYYVEYRQPLGFDAQITDRGVVDPNNAFKGVAIHQASPSNGNSGQLLDMTAGSNFVDMKDPALIGGRSFSDSGMTVTTQWTDASQALVSVDFGGGSSTPTCTRSAPSVSVSPGQSTWLAAGSSYTFTVSVTNKDSSGCTNSSFSLSSVKPSGWSASLGSASLSLAPGASASTTLKVTSPSTATDGFYSVGSSATANSRTASGTASFVIDNPTSSTNQAPKALSDSSLLTSLTAVNIAVLANDSDPDGDALKIVAFTQGSKGKVSLNSNGTLKYSPARSLKSTDQFSYTISDGKASASTTVNISLTR